MSESSLFSRRLREARLRLGLSQKALGIKAGIDPFSASPRMNQYEKGKHLPDVLVMERLAEALNVSVPYFFAKDDELAEILILLESASEEVTSEVRRILERCP
jgi:transcriptional regulator with XRE-family HTH domain